MNPDFTKLKIAIVAPVHIKLTNEWIKSLQSAAKNHKVIIVDDSDGQVELPSEWDVYDYAAQNEILGDEMYIEFKQFHKSSACRNFGHYVAYQEGYDVVIGLDSDCNVPPNFVSEHLKNIMGTAYGWENPTKNVGWFPRGYPYHERTRNIVLNIGLWENELDVNGIDRVKQGQPPANPDVKQQEIAHGMIPLCGMNFACWSQAIPGFLFLPNFDDGDEKFRRYDDIWGGYIFQKLMQKRKEMITYGLPIVYHDTIVDAASDAELEEAGIRWEENFYMLVDAICADIEPMSYESMFAAFADKAVEVFKDTPFQHLISSLQWWKKLYANRDKNS